MLAPGRAGAESRPPAAVPAIETVGRGRGHEGGVRSNILGTGLIMVLTLMYFPNGIVGTLAQKRKLPRFLNWD
jgi:hypothetical protein